LVLATMKNAAKCDT